MREVTNHKMKSSLKDIAIVTVLSALSFIPPWLVVVVECQPCRFTVFQLRQIHSEILLVQLHKALVHSVMEKETLSFSQQCGKSFGRECLEIQ